MPVTLRNFSSTPGQEVSTRAQTIGSESVQPERVTTMAELLAELSIADRDTLAYHLAG